MEAHRFGSSGSPRGRAVSLRICCELIGLSVRTGERRVADGTFPIPELPRLTPRSPHRFSSLDIDKYLAEASTADVRVIHRHRRASSLRKVG